MADEELGRSAVGVGGTGHRDDAAGVAKRIFDAIGIELAFDAIADFAAFGLTSSALDHEAFDDAMEDQAIVEAFLDERDEIGAGVLGGAAVELELHGSVILDVDDDHMRFLFFSIIEDFLASENRGIVDLACE